jgi:hypothetical protein
MEVCTPRKRIVAIFLVFALMLISAYSGYIYSECSWSRLLVLNDLMQIRSGLEIIQASREGKTEIVIDKTNINIESALGRIRDFDSTGSIFIDDFRYKTLSSMRKEWLAYPPVNSCNYTQAQDDTLRYNMEKYCLGLRQYLDQYQ